MKSGKSVCFGEIMMRLAPPGNQRLAQTHTLDITFGGAEANVAVALAGFGREADFVSRVPDNPLGHAAVQTLRGRGVSVPNVRFGGTRLGTYYLDQGASIRPSRVLYDRSHSAFAEAEPSLYEWPRILEGAAHLHVTGITAALSPACARAALDALACAKTLGVIISIDLNYRKNLWTRDEARSTMSDLVRFADILVANETDAHDVFGIAPQHGDAEAGRIDPDAYEAVARALAELSDARLIAVTLRESHSASDNGWSAVVLDDRVFLRSERYDLHVIDRVGSGDAFAAGLVHGYLAGWDTQRALDFAVAASALKHTIPGDFLSANVQEVESIAGGAVAGRVQR